jgi:hypothetical protein
MIDGGIHCSSSSRSKTHTVVGVYIILVFSRTGSGKLGYSSCQIAELKIACKLEGNRLGGSVPETRTILCSNTRNVKNKSRRLV